MKAYFFSLKMLYIVLFDMPDLSWNWNWNWSYANKVIEIKEIYYKYSEDFLWEVQINSWAKDFFEKVEGPVWRLFFWVLFKKLLLLLIDSVGWVMTPIFASVICKLHLCTLYVCEIRVVHFLISGMHCMLLETWALCCVS